MPFYFVPEPLVKEPSESEDCLYVNVYKKELPDSDCNRELPVLVMFHSGGFSFGSSNEIIHGPDFLLEHDVLYVSVNYRLGAFGFLSIPDREFDIPGNAGLKDQSLAMRWVSENCEHFGGDSNNITIMGLSAGGCSVHFHMISVHSKDLFHRAIVQSGSALCPWATRKSSHRGVNERLARALGWNGTGGQTAMFQAIIDAPTELIAQQQCNLYCAQEQHNFEWFLFVPVVEPYDNGTVFVDRDVQSMNMSAWGHRIPLIVGGTSGEGFLLHGYFERRDQLADRSNFDNAVPRELRLSVDNAKHRSLSDSIQKFYYANETPSATNIEPYLNMLTDKLFWHGIYAIVKTRLANADSAPTYLYNFDYSSNVLIPVQMWSCGKHVNRMVHADDILYQFRIPAIHDALSDDCVEVRLRQLYVSILNAIYIWAM